MPRSPRCRTALVFAMMALFTSVGAAQPIRIAGKIIAEKGGVKVELLSAYRSPGDALREPAPVASTRTAGDGSFELTAPGSGCYKVVIRSGSSLSKEHPLVPLVAETELLPAYLEEPRSLEIRTVGPDGRPLPGVEILATSEPYLESRRPGLSTWWIADRRGTTGADGTLVLPYASYEFLKLTATSPRFTHEMRLEPNPERSGPVVLRLSPRETPSDPSVRPEPPRTLVGKVVDAASGLPVPGAVVWSGDPLNSPPVHSGADGSFRLEAPAALERIWVNAAAAGYLLAERQSVTRKETGPLRLALDPAATLSGIVVDPEGQPVSGTLIGPAPQAERSLSLIRSQGTVKTGPDGRFRLSGLLPLGTYELTATLQGFAPTRMKTRTAAPGRPSPEVRIVLDPGRTVFGQVIDERGLPISGAALLLFINQRSGQITERFKASSDETGRFEIRGVSPGSYELLVQRAGFAQTHQTDVLIPAETKTADLGAITLPAGAAIEGRVTDTRGLPVAGAEVYVASSPSEEAASRVLQEEGGRRRAPAETDPEGSFRVGDLKPGGRFSVHVTYPGYVAANLSDVEAPTAEPLRIELRTARSLAGRVVGPEGEPVADAQLVQVEEIRTGSSRGRGGMTGTWKPLGSTDAEGRFRLTDLSPGPVNVEVVAKGYQPKRLEGLSIPEDKDVEGLEIALGRSAFVRVRVLTTDGESVAGAWVVAQPETPAEEDEFGFEDSWIPEDAMTDEQGMVLVEVPKPWRYRIYASRNGPSARAVVEVTPAGASVELRLAPDREVSGRVVGEDGLGIAGATVVLEQLKGPGAGVSYQIFSDADGSFSFPKANDGTSRLKASKRGYAETVYPEDVVVAGQPVRGIEIRLAEDETYGNASITGRLLGLAPEDLPQARVAAHLLPHRILEKVQGKVRKDGDAVYRIEGLAPGEWSVTASTASGHGAQATVRIEPGVSEVVADLDLTGFTLSGRLLVDGSPLAGVTVEARGRSGADAGPARTAHDGSFALRSLRPGRYELILGPEGGIGDIRTLDVTEDQNVVLQISTGKIAGRLVSRTTGEPVPDTAVLLDGWSQAIDYFFSMPSARSDESGAFESVRLAPGTYRLKVRKEGFAPAEITVTVRSGETTAIEIPLTLVE